MAKGIKLRNWSLDIRDYETDDLFHAAVAQELALFQHIGERFGIALIAAPIKQAFEGGSYATVGWSFQTATVPAAREQQPEPEVEEPEPVEVDETPGDEFPQDEPTPVPVDPYAEDA